MSEPFIGEIRPFGFNFPPRNWALCNGQLLPIAQNQALFALLGTTYGGDGSTTFALPDLRGRVPVHAGSSSAAGTVNLGEQSGVENVTLTTQQLPSHGHGVAASADLAAATSPAAAVTGAKPRFGADIYAAAGNPVALSNTAVGNAGGSQPHNNMQPSLTINFCICLIGIFPSRN
jgi:microcystin-dependent protein